MRFRRKAAGTIWALCFIVCSPALAATGNEQFKSDIEGFLNKLNVTTQGVLSWEGADSFDMRHDGEAAIAVISNARLSIHEAQTSQLVFDHVEIRRTPLAGSP